MMDEKVYLHTIFASNYYNFKSTSIVLEKILKSNAVLSKRNQNKEDYGSFCGLNYIALSDFEKRNLVKYKDYNGYNYFGKYNTSIIFPKDSIKAEEPIILNKKITQYIDYLSFMKDCGLCEYNRYSDLEDEAQVKDKISLDYMSGLMIPCYEIVNFWLSKEKNVDRIKRELELYRNLLLKYNKEVPIYDSITTICLDNDDNIKDSFDILKLQR